MVCKPFRRPRFEHPSIEDGETLMGLLVGLAVGLVVLAAGSALLAAVSGVTGLAIDLAADANLALVGFARGDRLSVYTHAERLVWAVAA